MSTLTAKKTKTLQSRNLKRVAPREIVSLDAMLTVEDWQELPGLKLELKNLWIK